MDIGSSGWMKNVDQIARQMEERLSLEGTVVVQRASELQAEAQKLARQRAFLREERRRARMDEEVLRLEKADLSMTKDDEWIPAECLAHHSEKRVRLNVGGQLFEASTAVLRRDPACLLAALCHDGGPLRADLDGTINVDRDWWMFRYIIKFLRDGILPTDTTLLTQLYREAGYWRCESLKRAIEEQMHLYRSSLGVGASGGAQDKTKDTEAWWCTPSTKWSEVKVEKPPVKEPEKPKETTDKDDWWTGVNYNGRKYAAVQNEVTSSATSQDIPSATSTTWTTGDDNSPPCI
ncbi:unnamed protein product [Ectocarpus sp. 8 AP-2014]